jgi:hypothetical protein
MNEQKAVLRDGTILSVGDEVVTNYHPTCIGKVFIVEEIIPYDYCESKTRVLVHLKDHPERKLYGYDKDKDSENGYGIDANWYKPNL